MVDSTNLPDVDINQIATDLNGKMDRDGVNATASVCVESYHDENGNWYRVYSDGWCEQGGYTAGANGGVSISLTKSYTNTYYHITYTPFQTTNTDMASYIQVKSKTTSTFFARTLSAGSANGSQFTWETKGYIR